MGFLCADHNVNKAIIKKGWTLQMLFPGRPVDMIKMLSALLTKLSGNHKIFINHRGH